MKQFKNSTIPVVFFGASKFVLPILEVLRQDYDLSLVLTTENLILASKGQALQGYGVIGYCIQYSIPYLVVKQFNNETIQQLKKVQAPLGILAYFGLILPKEVLNIFPKGIFNVHPSLLPLYRGPTPVQTAILNGDGKTGVTLIKLDDKVDHGPILAQVEEPILSTDTAQTLYERLFKRGAELLSQNIQKYIKGELKATAQNHSKATLTKQLIRQDGYFDINRPPSPEKLDRMIRAYYPWPGTWCTLRIKDKGLRIKFLPGQKIHVEGGKPMSYKDFLNGYPETKQLLKALL